MFYPSKSFVIKNMQVIVYAFIFWCAACCAPKPARAEHAAGNHHNATAERASQSDNAVEEDSQPIATDIALMEQYGADLKLAIPALLDGLHSTDVRIRRNAAFGLGELGADGEPALQALADVLRADADFEVRRNAAFALGEIGEPAIPILTSMLNDTDPRVRRTVGAALVRIGKPAVPHLVKLLTSNDATIRRNTAGILGGIGPNAQDAVPALEKAMQTPDKGFRWTAKQALRKINQTPPDDLAGGAPAYSERFRIDAKTDSQSNGAPAGIDISALITCLSDEKADVRRSAAFELAKIGTPAIPALLKAMESRNINTRKNAVFALGEMGKAAQSAAPAIAELKNDPNSSVRWVVENALKKIEGK